MAEQHWGDEVTTEKAWSRIGTNEWSQMEWFVRLANSDSFETMTRGEQITWEEEFVAMYLRGRAPVIGTPQNKKRYPRPSKSEFSERVPYLPTPAQMQEVRDAVVPHLKDLADDKGTLMGGFSVTLTISFHRNPSYNQAADQPRYLVYRGESGGAVANIYRLHLLLRMSRLLEMYVDNVRRCKHCGLLFLQLKRSAQYCGPKCYTVAGMRLLRAARRTSVNARKRSPQNKKKRVQ